MDMAGVRMPLESYPLQALVSEPVKPVFPCVVMSNTVHAYISQSDKGELVIGAGTDQYTSYSPDRRPAHHRATRWTRSARCSRSSPGCDAALWGGIVDVTPDRSRSSARRPVPGLYVNCGWGTGGFKATPGSANVFAHTIARDEPHRINAPFTLERFKTGRLIDEAAAAAVAH
jgi:sarcosine oxidase subunit beta